MSTRQIAGLLLLACAVSGASAQTPRPPTLLSEVRAAITAHDLARSEALVSKQRAEKGNTPEVLEALSWLARGAQSEGQRDRAESLAAEAQRLAVAGLTGRPVDSDTQLANA